MKNNHAWRFWLWITASFCLGTISSLVLIALVFFGVVDFNPENRLAKRVNIPRDELTQRRKQEMVEFLERKRRWTEKLVDRMHDRYLENPNSTMDFLVISGGGEHGAFGTGFLVGWSKVTDKNGSMPLFDGITGVSAGSLIAPFAYIGTKQSLEKINHFFRNTSPDFVVLRKPIFLAPNNMSLARVPGLERAVGEAYNQSTAQQIVDKTSSGRLLLIQSTNLDLAFPAVFNFVAAAKKSVAENDAKPMTNILLASTAIPGMFPPREMNGFLYVDGGVEGNFYYGGHPSKPVNTFGGIWKRKHPGIPIPKTRYWVIINGNLRESPKTSETGWASIAYRSLEVSEGSGQVVSLRELFSIAELTKLRGLGEVEVRWIAINEPLKRGVFPKIFNNNEMRRLSNLGESLGRDPNSWNLASP
ncbi:patatin-like phospholipase family protein [Synechococcus sp. KORDI-52]|uniref:patatin-like phospholipase family protein n=1 Tax=Synechococcus sp. KORDI-52 TaxID=585425 RepID=UPI0008FFC579|nr:patatin-like phospholipase family protein [Synechococcus sp. KORDI-52]